MRPITAVVLGAGGRGMYAYAAYAKDHPEELQIIGVAEPDTLRREKMIHDHAIPSDSVFNDWRDLLARPRFADLVFVCTQDRMHVEPAAAAMRLGYHILLEKPIAPTAQECLYLDQESKKYDVSIAVAHVLRYTPFFQTIKRLIDADAVGRVRGIQHNENIGHIHFSHSFVRGNWRNRKTSSPMILAKSCHDMDILLHLAGADCTNLSSYGSSGIFSAENRPADAPDRCLDGCPHAVTCPYYAPKIYMQGNTAWPVNAVTSDLTPKGIRKALEEGPYGRCVYACDNDMTEHQVVNLRFANEVTAVFSMSAFTRETSRTLKIVGERGEIRGSMERREIEVFDFSTRETQTISLDPQAEDSGHAGGDEGLMRNLIRHLWWRDSYPLETSLSSAIQSHIMAFAAEDSMFSHETVDLESYRKAIAVDGGMVDKEKDV